MNSSTDVDARIRDVMSEILEVEPGAIRDGFQRDDAPGWDSLNHLRLVSALEEAFRIKFTMKEVGEMDRYEAVRQTVSSRLQG